MSVAYKIGITRWTQVSQSVTFCQLKLKLLIDERMSGSAQSRACQVGALRGPVITVNQPG